MTIQFPLELVGRVYKHNLIDVKVQWETNVSIYTVTAVGCATEPCAAIIVFTCCVHWSGTRAQLF